MELIRREAVLIDPAWLRLVRQATLDSDRHWPWFAQETRQVWPVPSEFAVKLEQFRRRNFALLVVSKLRESAEAGEISWRDCYEAVTQVLDWAGIKT
jgi:hypothetical protein